MGRAEGNAFFTTQLLRALEDEGALRRGDGGWALGDLATVGLPAPLRQVLDVRVDRLGEAARDLLAVAAVIGQEVPLTLWAAVAETDEDGLLDTIVRAVDARLLAETPDGAGVRFAHALIREALYEGTLALRRRRLHRRAGEVLAALSTPDPDAVANQYRRAGDDRAAAWLIKAGEWAQRAYAWVTAAARYEAALALLEQRGADVRERAWLVWQLALLSRYLDTDRALGHAGEARRLADEAGDRLLAAISTFLAGLLRCYLGDTGRGLAELEDGLHALAALPHDERIPPGADAPLAVEHRWGTVILWKASTGRLAEARALGERYLASVPELLVADWLGGNPYADAHVGLALARAALGDPAAAWPLYARGIDPLQWTSENGVEPQEVSRCRVPMLLTHPSSGPRRCARPGAATNRSRCWPPTWASRPRRCATGCGRTPTTRATGRPARSPALSRRNCAACAARITSSSKSARS